MKVKIKVCSKQINERGIPSIYASVEKAEEANKLAILAIDAGASKDLVTKMIKKSDWKGEIGYAFNVNCSSFTLQRVNQFDLLTCDIVFCSTAKGFIYAKINVIDKIEQIFKLEKQTQEQDEVTGWSISAPDVKEVQQLVSPDQLPPTPFEIAQNNSLNPNDASEDLPF